MMFCRQRLPVKGNAWQETAEYFSIDRRAFAEQRAFWEALASATAGLQET